MKHFLLLLFLVAGVPGVLLLAQNDNPRPEIEELITVMRMQKLCEDSIAQTKKMMSAVQPPGEESARSKEIQDKTFALVEREMRWDKMKGDYIKIYAAMYTPDQARQLIEFYKSPLGQVFLDKQPLLMQKTIEMTQKKMAGLMPELQKILAEKDAPVAPAAGPHVSSPRTPFAGDHHDAALRILEELRLLDSATDQYAIETNKTSGMNPAFADLKNYLKAGTALYDTGADALGNSYGPFTVDSIPKVSGKTFNVLSDVADESFWTPYK